MSANRFTVACWTAESGVEPPRSCVPSSPHDHCTVPASKTSAPLDARYIVIECVAVPGPYVEPWSWSTSGSDAVVDDRSIWPAGRDAVVEILVPLVAERPVRERGVDALE